MEHNSKRLAKNTFFLYVRMLIMMFVNLYTSRVILNTLGVSDFGVYNVVGGVVVLFSFLNGPMSIATQRFMTFYIGKGEESIVNRVFNISISLYLLICIFVVICAETIGLWFLNNKMVFDENRIVAVNYVYQFTILTSLVSILRIPYNSIIVSYERMNFFAYISLLEAFGQLFVAFSITFFSLDKLVLYVILLFILNTIINIVYIYYCKVKFCTKIKLFWDKSLSREIISFSVWSIWGSIGNLSASQGVNVIINMFGGTMINAAVGIANQASGVAYKFISNFQMAFNPQIVKQYASGNTETLNYLIFNTSKYSYFLFYLLSLPVFLYVEDLLLLWLGTVPDYTVSFCRLMILFLVVDAVSAPFWMVVQATGNIKTYQIIVSFIIFLNIPLCYIAFKFFDASYYVAFIIKVLVNVIAHIYRLLYLRKHINLPVNVYIRQALMPVVFVTLLSCPIPLCMFFLDYGLMSTSVISIICSMIAVYYVGLDRKERTIVNKQVNKIRKKILI